MSAPVEDTVSSHAMTGHADARKAAERIMDPVAAERPDDCMTVAHGYLALLAEHRAPAPAPDVREVARLTISRWYSAFPQYVKDDIEGAIMEALTAHGDARAAEAREECAKILDKRAAGYKARPDSDYDGHCVAGELKDNAAAIRAIPRGK